MNDWRRRLDRLALDLTESGQLPEPWRDAFHATPRHVLVPRFYEQDATGRWNAVDGTNPTADYYLDAVYSDRTLITALVDDHGPWGIQQIPVSSSTLPSLMLRMLSELDPGDGDTVLEIGTGTGYNAALLCAHLGADRVYSVDLRAELVAAARERLASLGHHPTLAATDGATGLPDFGPYDRIIATCAERHIPPAWLGQLAPGGTILADLKGGLSAGNLITLHRPTEKPQAEGRFLPWWAGFMTMAHTTTPQPATRTERPAAETRHSDLDPAVLDEPVFAFLAQTHLPHDIGRRHRRTADGGDATVLVTSTGDWTSIQHEHTAQGYRVQHSGTDHWSAIETAHDLWWAAGKPDWPRLGLTMTPHHQRVWLDEPTSTHTWPLHAPSLG